MANVKALFKYPRKIDGKLYSKGEHFLSKELADHWYLQGLVASGQVALLDEVKQAEINSKAQAKPKPKQQAIFKPGSKPAPKKKPEEPTQAEGADPAETKE